jgi:hypothetical protein
MKTPRQIYRILRVAYVRKGCMTIFRVTNVWFFTGVNSLVDFQGRLLVEPFVAVFFGAQKRPIVCMNLIMPGEVTFANKFLI